MNDRKLFKLAVVAAIMVALACLVSMPRNKNANAVAANTPLLQGLDTKGISAIEVSGVGKKTRLVKTETGFVVESRNNYPALYEEVNKLLVSCLDIKVSEFVTANPDNYIDLQVTEAGADRLIKFFDQDGKLIAGVIIGKKDQQSGRVYVRTVAADEKTATGVYLAETISWIYTNPVSYVEKNLLQCGEADVKSISVTDNEGTYTVVTKTDEKGTVTPELQAIPEGKEAQAASLKQILEAATDISFDDLQPEADTDKSLKFDTRVKILTADQSEMTLQMAKGTVDGAEKYFVKCSSRYDNKEFVAKVQSGNLAIAKDKESMETADTQLQVYQAVQDFNARHKGWVYVFESYKGSKLAPKLADLVKDIAAAPKSDTNPDAGPSVGPIEGPVAPVPAVVPAPEVAPVVTPAEAPASAPAN